MTQVSGWRSFLRDLRMVPCGNLPKLPAAFRLGAKMDKRQAHFAKVREIHEKLTDHRMLSGLQACMVVILLCQEHSTCWRSHPV